MANNSSRYYAKAIEFGILLAVFVTPLILLFDLPYGYLGHQIVTLLHVQDPTHWITPGALIIKTVFFDLVVLVLFALWIMECATANRLVFVRAPLDWPLAAFLFWNLISVFWSKYDYATLTQAGKYVTYSFLYWMVVAHIREPRQIRRLLWTIFLSVTVTCVYGIAQFLGHDFFFWYPQDPRIMSSLGNATFYAAHLILLLPLALNLFLAGGWPQALPGKPELPAGGTPVLPWRRTAGVVALGVLVALMYFCLLATYTRAAWLALLVVTVLDLGLLARYAGWLRAPRRRTVLSAAGLAVLLAAVTALMAVEGSYSLSQRLASSFKVDMSNVQRIMAWKAAYQEFRTHPLLGTGSGTFFDHVAGYLDPEFYNTGDAAWIEHAHNEILEQAAETGIVGVGLFLWLIVAFAGMALRVTRRAADPLARYLAPALLCGALAFLGQNLAGVSLRYTTGAAYLWLVMGLVAVLIPTSASLEPALVVRRGPLVGRKVTLAVLLMGRLEIAGQ